jgi:hypothetical protein
MKDCKPFLNFGEQWDQFTIFLGRFKPDEEVECIVRKVQTKSSHRQNSYYWAVIVHIISEYTGHEPDEIHDLLKWKFLKRRDDKGLEYVPSSMDLSTVDREKYHGDCRHWASVVLNLNIPLPNEAT